MDLQGFMAAALEPRRQTIDVPELADWFADEEPKWTVRGLTAAELVRSRDGNTDALRTLVEALAGAGDKAQAIRSALGIADGEVPAEVSRRIETLSIGSVSPELGELHRDVAVKLAEGYPIVFMRLTNAIDALTVQGADPGKSQRSGPIPA